MGEALALCNAAGLSEAHRIAGTAPALARLSANGCHRALPSNSVFLRLDEWDALHRTPTPKLGKTAIVLLNGLYVRVRPANRWFEALLAEQAHRLERTRGAAGMEQ